MAIPAGAVARVREALASETLWTLRAEPTDTEGASPARKRFLDLPVDDRLVEVEATVEDRPARLELLVYVPGAGPRSDAELAAHRAYLHLVYARLRQACPDLPSWPDTEEIVHTGSRARLAPFFRATFTLLVVLLFSCCAILAWVLPRRRREEDARRRSERAERLLPG